MAWCTPALSAAPKMSSVLLSLLMSFATTPDELPNRVTLFGILQNGDMVLRTPNGGTDDSVSDGGGNGAVDPECGIGGCGPIL